MKNGTLSIAIFEALDQVAKAHKVKLEDWARSSNAYQARISELRRIAKNPNKKKEVGRAVSIEKVYGLYEGLRKQLGDDLVNKELQKIIKRLKTRKERLLLMCLMTPDEKSEKKVEMFLKEVLNIEEEV